MKKTVYAVLLLLLTALVPACEKANTNRSYTENKMNDKIWESDDVYAGFAGDEIHVNFRKYKKIDGINVVWDQLF